MEECRTCGMSAEGGLSLLDPEQQELTDFVKHNLRNGEVRYHNHVWRRKTEPCMALWVACLTLGGSHFAGSNLHLIAH
jgi:hypothetical protein